MKSISEYLGLIILAGLGTILITGFILSGFTLFMIGSKIFGIMIYLIGVLIIWILAYERLELVRGKRK